MSVQNLNILPSKAVIKMLFFDAFGELYRLVAEKGKFSAEQIKAYRQNLKTKEIIIKIRSKLDTMLLDVYSPRGDLIDKALNYLHSF